MLLQLDPAVGVAERHHLASLAASYALTAHPLPWYPGVAYGLVGRVDAQPVGAAETPLPSLADRLAAAEPALGALPWIRRRQRVTTPYVLVSRALAEGTRTIDVAGVPVGGRDVALMAGPCAVEDEAQLLACAAAAHRAGARFLRGGAYKPRTSPYEFQGLGPYGLELLAKAAAAYDLRVVTEVVSPDDVETVAATAHLLQIGARNMQNFALLRAVGRQRRPVLLKRGLSASLKEWLCAAEYVAAHGNPNIILCERGIRTYATETRNTLDVVAVPVLRTLTHLPVVVDPSHATGRRDVVLAAARAGVAAGADGILVEVHPEPERALSDGPQSLTLPGLATLAEQLARLAPAVDRSFARSFDPSLRPDGATAAAPNAKEAEHAA